MVMRSASTPSKKSPSLSPSPTASPSPSCPRAAAPRLQSRRLAVTASVPPSAAPRHTTAPPTHSVTSRPPADLLVFPPTRPSSRPAAVASALSARPTRLQTTTRTTTPPPALIDPRRAAATSYHAWRAGLRLTLVQMERRRPRPLHRRGQRSHPRRRRRREVR